jgi:hypothetical protein
VYLSAHCGEIMVSRETAELRRGPQRKLLRKR